jgi:hypothetical protein
VVKKSFLDFTGDEMADQLDLLAKAWKNIYPRLKTKYMGRALTKTARPLVSIYKKTAKQRYPGGMETYTTKGGKTRRRRTKGGLEKSAGIGKPISNSEQGIRDATLGIFVGYRRNVASGYKAVWLAKGTKVRTTTKGVTRGKMPGTDLQEVTSRQVQAQGSPKLSANLAIAYEQAAAQQIKNYDYESKRFKDQVARKAKGRR